MLLACVVWGAGCASDPEPIDPGARFELLCIEGPPSTADAPEHWRAIAEAGFTLVTPGYPYDEAWQKTTLDRCAELGLRAVPRVKVFEAGQLPPDWRRRVTREAAAYRGHPAMFGYFLTDEPNARLFGSIARVQRAFVEEDPRSVPCVNLYPTYASVEQLGTTTYAEHLAQFVQTVDPHMLCYDNYPFLKNGTDRGGSLDDFFLNLELARDAALAHGIPAWLAGQCDWWSGLRETSEAELRVQAYAALAYGFKGIGYFTYWPVNRPYESAVDYQGNRQPLYDRIKNVNLRVRRLGNVLVKMRSFGVYHAGRRVPGGCARLPQGSPIWIGDEAEIIVGLFEDARGRTYAMLANRDYQQPARFRISLAPGRNGLWTVGGGGAEKEITLTGGVAELALPPGGGVLLRLGDG
ncbi:MAG: hypothetical protein ACYTGQ_08860 [Planctomycetota bacterium]